jgi:hypothetical protein
LRLASVILAGLLLKGEAKFFLTAFPTPKARF